jgi:Protein of unknown function (DUF1064)
MVLPRLVVKLRARKHKYNAKPCEVNGIKYRSQKEMKRHQDLLLMEKAGQISDLKREVPFVLFPSTTINGKKVREVKYIADYTYFNLRGELICEDTKGFRTPVYKLKKIMMKHIWDIDILET